MAKRAWMVLTLFIMCVAMPTPVTVFAQDEEELDEETKLLKEGLPLTPTRMLSESFTEGSWISVRTVGRLCSISWVTSIRCRFQGARPRHLHRAWHSTVSHASAQMATM